jgi:hypothetical protein
MQYYEDDDAADGAAGGDCGLCTCGGRFEVG